MLRREYLSLAVNGLTNSPQRLFQPEFPAKESINKVKVLWLSFEQYLRPFTMLLAEESSKMGPFRYLSNHIFSSR